MVNTAVVGLQWGDEAKGKKVDSIAPSYSLVLRYNGGCNAGHTVVIVGGEPYKLNLVPSGVLRGVKCAIADQVALHPKRLIEEIDNLKKRGIDIRPDNFFISDGANLTTSFQVEYDGVTGGKIGTTKRGTGPTYADRCARRGLIVHYLFDVKRLEEEVKELAEYYELNFTPFRDKVTTPNVPKIMEDLLEAREKLLPYVTKNIQGLVLENNGNLLFEAAQGALLDLYLGGYPDVTSSNASVGGVVTSCGVNVKFDKIIGVLKAYITRVGGGPLPTEQKNEYGNILQKIGHEIGTTTGRTRRCGWLDLFATNYAAIANRVNELDVTKLDVLDTFSEIPVCIGYRIDGKKVNYFPRFELETCQPIYETLQGWLKDTTSVRRIQDLPTNARKYLDNIETKLGVPVKSAGVGERREQIAV